ncbi:hypothetical protein BGZ70_001887 [Mortierella alpina]|uniref:Adhesin domain-containing protein n=1 Tax=Mortierella alpina TaxID=64518 RepID=A0A9P6JDT5_MORAP|nr:hypothetical protein BGZ70_001887 [Mortierella alpina]
MDVKKVDPALASWDAQTEQDIFGNQAPYAAGPHISTAPSTTSDDDVSSIYQAHPYRPHTTHFPQSPPYLESIIHPDKPQNLPGRLSTRLSPISHRSSNRYPSSPFRVTDRWLLMDAKDVQALQHHSCETGAATVLCQEAAVVSTSHWSLDVKILLVDPCALTNDSLMHYNSVTWQTEPSGELSVTMLDHIPGNVIIRENDDWDEESVLIEISKRSTSTKVLDSIHLRAEALETPAVILRLTTLMQTKDADETKKLLRGHCTKMETKIIYPKGIPYPQLLIVNGVLGNIRVELDKHMAILDRVRLNVTNGSILIDGLSVRDEATFSVGTGKVQGTMRAIGEVNMETADGDIDVVLHPSLAFLDFGPENLNVTMKSTEGSVNLVMAQRYQGHFSLNAGNKQPATFLESSEYPDVVKYSAHSESRSEGWITEDGKKPAKALPRLALSSDAGSAVVLIED